MANMLIDMINRYKEEPLAFVKEVLKAKPTRQQEEVLIDLPNTRNIAIKSGHGTGKTALLSWLVLWYMFTRPMCRIPITAPTMHQLNDVFWAELSFWLAKSELLNKLFEKTASKLMPKSDKYKNSWFATLVSARKPENMQGFHGQDLLFIVDEASGVNDGMFEVIDGALTNEGARLVMVGNPTRNNGYFYNAFHGNADVFKTYTFSSLESPLVSKTWLKKMERLYGVDSDVYRVRVLGEFPRIDSNFVIPLSWIEQAILNEDKVYGDVVIGVDVARSGDDKTAIVVRNGYVIEKIFVYSKLDTVEVADEVDKIANLYRAKIVAIEAVGFGAGVLDIIAHRIKKERRKYKLYQFIPQAKAVKSEQFVNAMTEAWWNLRGLFKPTAAGFPIISMYEDELAIQHLSCREYEVDDKGKISLMDKVTTKKKYGFSPDIGDAMAIAFYNNLQPAKHSVKSSIKVLRRRHSEWAEYRNF